MVAFARSIAGGASLSSVLSAPSFIPNANQGYHGAAQCEVATVTVYETVNPVVHSQKETVTPTGIAPAATTPHAAASAQESSNPHGHGGPYYNPYNDVPMAYDWPGKPSQGEMYPPPMPSPPFEYGGPAKDRYEAPGWVPKGEKLKSSLPKGKQNGDSYWGEVDCPRLPISGLPNGPSRPSGYPVSPPYPIGSGNSTWSNGTSNCTTLGHRPTAVIPTSISVTLHPTGMPTIPGVPTGIVTATQDYGSTPTSDPNCPTMPDTGVTRTYELNVAYQTIAPDGVLRNGLTINGQFPGPLVEANWGDWILFKVTNELTDEGTTIHAHGLFQTNQSWYDGVPAVDQCPIIPGSKFDMLFRADRYGTSWYHSHYSAQYSGGAHGAMIVYGPKHADYDIDVGPIVLEDWYHADYFSLVERTLTSRIPPSNNVLINGKNNYPCQNTTLPCTPNAGVSKFKFESGKKHLLRLINAGAEGVQKFSLDGHKLTVVAVDFIPVEPYETNVVTLSIGQRTDVVVEAVGQPGDAYWMRSRLGTFPCTLSDGISPGAVAAVYYDDADTESVPTTTSDVTAEQLALCKNDPLDVAIPLCKIPIEDAEHTERIEFDFRSNGTSFIWYVNNSSYRGDYNQPILPSVNQGNFNFDDEWNVYNFGNNKTVRLHVVNYGLVGGHPMHLHGHDFHVLAEGFGEWDGTVTNAENTVRRDVHTLQNAREEEGTEETIPSYIVIQYTQDNPGVWPFHCHLAWHVSGGLFMSFIERPEEVMDQEIPESLNRLCNEWDAYSAEFPPNQIDSGL